MGLLKMSKADNILVQMRNNVWERIMTHSVEIAKIYSHHVSQELCENNVFITKSKWLLFSRKYF